MANEVTNIQNPEIVLYKPDESTSLEVRFEDETVWLTQAQMIALFNSSKANISEHISNIYKQGELMPESTVRKFRTVRKEGNRIVSRELDFYNLDMIISVGFRVNSAQGIRFRQWRNESHDRWLIIDDSLYHCGHSLNAIGNKMSAITLMGINPNAILSQIK